MGLRPNGLLAELTLARHRLLPLRQHEELGYREGIGYTIDFVTAYKSIIYNYKGKGGETTSKRLV
ncbi:MAG: hypothetical protein MGAcid_12710 [uncultured Acidilobus sp. MG]|jgi:nonphosphorylating glyceraldehyde-3-phosphate dehydrogenase (EC 1.2.1.9)|nr:MAG: hypothetical protein MGAcid_12710 [uncultured Acidilobus sp. MG]